MTPVGGVLLGFVFMVLLHFGTEASIVRNKDDWIINVEVCLKPYNDDSNENQLCVTCTPCPTQDTYIKLEEHCKNAKIDCLHLCEDVTVEWNEHVLSQQYIEILSSPCHFVKTVVIFNNETTPTTTGSIATEVIGTTSGSNSTFISNEPTEAYKTKSLTYYRNPLWIAAWCCVSIVLSAVLVVFGVCAIKLIKRKDVKSWGKSLPSRIICVKAKIKDTSDDLGKWRSIIQNRDVHSQLTLNTDPIDLLVNAPGLFSQAEEQEIKAKYSESGPIRACEHLVSILLISQNPHWPEILRNALRECGMDLTLQLFENRFQETQGHRGPVFPVAEYV